jgi:LPS-assembly protein
MAAVLFTTELRAQTGTTTPATTQTHPEEPAPPPSVPPSTPPQNPPASAKVGFAKSEFANTGEEVTIKAKEQEKAGDIYTLRGDVEIDFRELVLRGDEISYNAKTGDVTATGHLVLDGGPHDEHIEASHGTYNVRSQTGQLYDVTGTTGIKFQGKRGTLTSAYPFAFAGKMVEKTGPDRYVIHHGMVTSCELPKPKWSFNAGKMVVVVGGNAAIYNSNFRVRGVPVFYFPYASHPVNELTRHSGFTIPVVGVSSRKGVILGDSFYWAINRSVDATVGAEYFSSRGWAQNGEFRAKPSENSYVNFRYFGVLDRGLEPTHVDQGGEDIHLNAESPLPWGARGVVSANYLSSFVFRLAFGESFSEAVDSEVKSVGFASKSVNGFDLNLMASRYQNFESTIPADYVSIVHAPSLELSSTEHYLGPTRAVWWFDGAAEGVSRHEPGFNTGALVGRYDAYPHAALPLLWRGWSLRPEVALRETYYTERRVPITPVGVVSDDDVSRRTLESAIELRPPAIARVFDKTIAGHQLKHAIETWVTYRTVNGIENLPNIIRFDARDILSDTNELEYGFIQRLYSKRVKARGDMDCPADTLPDESGTVSCADNGPHELASWEVKQKYFFDATFDGTVVNGKRNVFTTTAEYAGIAFLTEPRVFAPIVSKLRVFTGANTDGQWELDYDTKKGRINASTVVVNYRAGDYFLGAAHSFFHAPGEIFTTNPIPGPDRFNQFRILSGYGNPTKPGASIAANVGFDTHLNFLQYCALQGSYNWDCCGISVEYRRYALGSVRNENQFRFAFTLANVASFGNMKQRLRLY